MQTIRQQIISLLKNHEMNAREISKALGIREKAVYDHLEHIRHSIKPQKKKLMIHPFHCLNCDYMFKDRERLSRPGRCPKCRQEHIEAATFKIV